MKGKEGQKQFSGFGFAQSRGSAPTLGKLQLHRNETSKHDPERLDSRASRDSMSTAAGSDSRVANNASTCVSCPCPHRGRAQELKLRNSRPCARPSSASSDLPLAKSPRVRQLERYGGGLRTCQGSFFPMRVTSTTFRV